MAHPEYWKLKAAYLAAQQARLQAEVTITRAESQLGFVMKMAGLDPQKTYDLNDENETITERQTAALAPV